MHLLGAPVVDAANRGHDTRDMGTPPDRRAASTVSRRRKHPRAEPTSTSQEQLFATPVQGSATDERYTPRWVFEGMNTTFDLDPCSPGPGLCPAADWCHTSWTAEDDGLNRPWIGLVWCNPPYSKPGPWARKMIDHGHGVMLMPFSSSAAWVQELLAAIDLLWIPKTVRFDHPLESATTISFAVFFAGLGRGTTAVATLASSGRMPGALWHPAQTIS